jgi:hypothetical protein
VLLDYFVRFHSGDADHSSERGSKKETNPCAVAHSGLPSFLRSDDHAYRRTRLGHSIAAQSYQDLDDRQRGTVDDERKGRRRSANGPDESAGPRAGSLGSNSVKPYSVNPDSVNPGSVDPGSTAAPCPRPYRQNREGPAPASARTCCGFDRSASRFANDLVPR